MRSELYRVLRRELKEAGLDTAYLAQLLGRSPSSKDYIKEVTA